MDSPANTETAIKQELLFKEVTWCPPGCRCCCCFVEVLSGACLLLLVTVLLTLLRYFLEFPAIMKGFGILQSANTTSVPRES